MCVRAKREKKSRCGCLDNIIRKFIFCGNCSFFPKKFFFTLLKYQRHHSSMITIIIMIIMIIKLDTGQCGSHLSPS